MEDSQIVELYWNDRKAPFQRRRQNTENTVTELPLTYLEIGRMRKKA